MKKKYLLNYLLGVIVLVSVSSVYAGVKLDDIDISTDDRLIFTAQKKIPDGDKYKSLYYTKLGDEKINSSPSILTYFPERMELINEGKILQIRNIDGVSRYNIQDEKIIKINEEKTSKNVRTFPVVVSSDGKWYCTVEPVKKASGNLVLVNSKTLLQKIIVQDIELDYSSLKVKWSPDGKALLYEKNNCVYFTTPDAVFKNLQTNDTFRKIGQGTIDSVQWIQSKKILYVKDDVVYSIDQNELYTRGLYSTLVGNGKIIARLPIKFSFLSDKFWCNANGSRIAIISNGNILYLYTINEEKNTDIKIDLIYPLTSISKNSLGFSLFWNTNNKALLWNDTIDYENNEKNGTLYSIENDMIILTKAKKSFIPILSPDNKKIAYTDDGKLKIFDLSSMNEIEIFNKEPVVSIAWNGKNNIYVGGKYSVSLFNFISQESKVLFLSSVDKAYWNGGFIIAKIPEEKGFYYFDSEKNIWKSYNGLDFEMNAKDRNGKYRAYSGSCLNPKFENTIFVRSLSTKAFTYSVFPEAMQEEKKQKKVALVFDAMENAEGLENILYTLSKYELKGTFFINGEFIRRYPEKAKLIADSKNECGSLFWTSADLVENNFVIDSSFIIRGLARNEDEYFATTQKELSLLWHAPYYHDTELIRESGKDAGYEYVSAFSKFSDRITYENSLEKGKEYKTATQIIDSIIEELHNGMVIPVNIGKVNGTRKDYVYEKLDLLISAIIESGYDITEVRLLK